MFFLLNSILKVMCICYEREVLFPHRKGTGSQLFEWNPNNDIIALQTSVKELENEVYLDKTYRYHAKLPIIFMASSALNFATLKPNNLPDSDVAVDIYIIRNQDVILSQFFHNDTALNWQFDKFVSDFQTRFCQDIIVSKQNYNQILVLKKFWV